VVIEAKRIWAVVPPLSDAPPLPKIVTPVAAPAAEITLATPVLDRVPPAMEIVVDAIVPPTSRRGPASTTAAVDSSDTAFAPPIVPVRLTREPPAAVADPEMLSDREFRAVMLNATPAVDSVPLTSTKRPESATVLCRTPWVLVFSELPDSTLILVATLGATENVISCPGKIHDDANDTVTPCIAAPTEIKPFVEVTAVAELSSTTTVPPPVTVMVLKSLGMVTVMVVPVATLTVKLVAEPPLGQYVLVVEIVVVGQFAALAVGITRVQKIQVVRMLTARASIARQQNYALDMSSWNNNRDH
jgi:hypothetical protein